MIRIVVPFLFMIYDSSSNQIYDFCIFTFFQNLTFLQTPLYIPQTLQILQILQILQSYNLTDNVPARVVHLTDNVPAHLNNTCSYRERRGAASHRVTNLQRCFPSCDKPAALRPIVCQTCTVTPVALRVTASLHLYLPACCVAAAQHPHITPPAAGCVAVCQPIQNEEPVLHNSTGFIHILVVINLGSTVRGTQ